MNRCKFRFLELYFYHNESLEHWRMDLLHIKVFRITHCSAAKDCGSLAVPMNGSATGGETTYPNDVTFDCDDGFIMAGSRIRKCQSNGLWSGNKTSCTGII